MRVPFLPTKGLSMTGLLAMALLTGCGQKGPLYFAPQPAAEKAPAAQPAHPEPAAPKQQQEQGTDHQQQNDGN